MDLPKWLYLTCKMGDIKPYLRQEPSITAPCVIILVLQFHSYLNLLHEVEMSVSWRKKQRQIN